MLVFLSTFKDNVISGDSSMSSSSDVWLHDISLFTLNLSIRGGSNERAAGGRGSQP